MPFSGYTIVSMSRAAPSRTVFAPNSAGKWSATMQTADGPVTAVGDSVGEARRALDELLVIERALEVARDRLHRRTISGRSRVVVYPRSNGGTDESG
jgi:hypothetical protein